MGPGQVDWGQSYIVFPEVLCSHIDHLHPQASSSWERYSDLKHLVTVSWLG